MNIGELAKRVEVNVQTIRYYEKEGLIPIPHRWADSNYRDFNEDYVKMVRFIKSAKELGFTLREIKELFELKIEPDSACDEVKDLVEEKLKDVEEKLATMRKIKRTLRQLAKQCEERKPSSACPILEALDN